MLINPTDATLQMRVKIKVHSRTNDETYIGTITGLANYDVAMSMGSDLAARHEEIRDIILSTTGDDLQDLSTEKFLILDIGELRPLVVAYDWIDGQIEVIEKGQTIVIELIDATMSDANLALSVLRQHGLACRIR
jgi:hypothetical protein